jgi:hypothetical protein
VVKASRRAIFSGFFRRSTFELDHSTANEILMRINRSLDPIPLTEGMWASYVAARRSLHFARVDAAAAATPTKRIEPGNPADLPELRTLSESVAKDLAFLMRVETVMRRWVAGGSDAPAADVRRDLDEISAAINQYLDGCEQTAAYKRDIEGPILRCLASAAGVRLPSPGRPSPARDQEVDDAIEGIEAERGGD